VVYSTTELSTSGSKVSGNDLIFFDDLFFSHDFIHLVYLFA
jgi:hypothetical protein